MVHSPAHPPSDAAAPDRPGEEGSHGEDRLDLDFGLRRVFRRASVVLLVLTCGGAALAIGGFHKETIAACAIGAALALACVVVRSSSVRFDSFAWVLLGLAVTSALQIIPLPMSLLERLAPASAATWRGARAALEQSLDASAPVSIDPHATAQALLLATALLAIYLAAYHLSRKRRYLDRLLRGLIGVGVGLVVIGVLQVLTGTSRILWLYDAAYPMNRMPFFSTFVSPNHLAAFLDLVAPLALSYATALDDAEKRARWLVVFGVLAFGVIATFSRAGIGALVLSTGLIVAFGESGKRPISAAVVVAVLVVGAAIAGPLGLELKRMSTDVSASGWAVEEHGHTLAWRAAQRWPWTGSGRATYAAAATQVNTEWPGVTLTHAHSVPLELCAELGFVMGPLLMLLGMGFVLRAAWRRRGEPHHRAIAAALCGLGLHNLVDFNLDMPGIALTAATLVGALTASRRTGVTTSLPMLIGAAAVPVVALVVTLRTIPELGPRRDVFIRADPQRAAQSLPGDYFAFLQTGATNRDVAALRHAHALHPSDVETLLALAQLTDRDEAFAHLHRIIALTWRRIEDVKRVLESRSPTPAEVLAVLPDDPERVAAYLTVGRPRGDVLRLALERWPEGQALLALAARLALDKGALAVADQYATALVATGSRDGYRMLGLVHRAEHRYYEAYHLLLEAGDPLSMLDAAECAILAGRAAEAVTVLDRAALPPHLLARQRELRDRAVTESTRPPQ